MPKGLYDIAPLSPLIESGYIVLTPNSRLARRVATEWNHAQQLAGRQAWVSPSVMPMKRFLLHQWEQAVERGQLPPGTLISGPLQHQLWRQVIAADASESTLSLLSASSAAQLAQQAADTLQQWQIEPTEARWSALFSSDTDTKVFLDWWRAWRQALQAREMLTEYDAIALVQGLDLDPASMPRVALLECLHTAPLLTATIEAVSREVLVVEEWLQRQSQAKTELEECDDALNDRRVAHAFVDKRSELEGIAHWLYERHQSDAGARLGVVLEDMQGDRAILDYYLRKAFDCLDQQYAKLPVNFSTGLPLAEAPVVRDALATLALGLTSVQVPQVVRILTSRYLAFADADSPLLNHFIERLYANGVETLEMGALRNAANEISLEEQRGLHLGELLLEVSTRRSLKQTHSAQHWARHFSEFLSLFGWPGNNPLDSLEYQQVMRWYEMLDDFAAYDAITGSLNFEQALTLLRELSQRTISQPQTVDSRIQVLGPLEAVGLQFDELWVAGMQAGRWPPAARPNPFIPLVMQHEYEMPRVSAEREWQMSHDRLEQYARCSGVLHGSYFEQEQGVSELASPLLETFQVVEPLVEAVVNDNFSAGLELEQIRDIQGAAVDTAANPEAPGGSGVLREQSHCPFRAFARYRLHANALGEFSLGLSAAERGELVHSLLEYFWSRVESQAQLLALEAAELNELVQASAKYALSRIRPARRQSLPETFFTLEQERLQALLSQWLECERKRAAFVVAQREEKLRLSLAGLTFNLRADRMDVLDDNQTVVIDYKTGQNAIGDLLDERPREPQLLMYAAALDVEPKALAFARVKADACAYTGLSDAHLGDVAKGIVSRLSDKQAESHAFLAWSQQMAQWRYHLEALVREFVSGHAAVAPQHPNSCTWCGLQPLCRIEHAVPEVGEQDNEDPVWDHWQMEQPS